MPDFSKSVAISSGLPLLLWIQDIACNAGVIAEYQPIFLITD
jgi:hypothetical protein